MTAPHLPEIMAWLRDDGQLCDEMAALTGDPAKRLAYRHLAIVLPDLADEISRRFGEGDGWRAISEAPRDGTTVDLWIVGKPSSVEFLAPVSTATADRKSLQGRICDWRWIDGDWRPCAGLQRLVGLRMHDVVAVGWRPLPPPPRSAP